MIDINVSFGNWPFQRFNWSTPAGLVGHLRRQGIDMALVSPLEAVLAPDPLPCNRDLARKLRRFPELLPVPVVNPCLSNWREALEACGSSPVAVKLFPNYHGYSPTDAGELCDRLERESILPLIQMRIEDERGQHPLFKVPGVTVASIRELALAHPRLPFLCLAAYRHEAVELAESADNIYIDIAFTECLDTLPTLLNSLPAERLCFGSQTPFLYTRAAVSKVEALVDQSARRKIAHDNACRLFPRLSGGVA